MITGYMSSLLVENPKQRHQHNYKQRQLSMFLLSMSHVHGIVVKKFSSVSFMRHFYASQSIISMDFQVIFEFFPFSRIQLLINFLHRECSCHSKLYQQKLSPTVVQGGIL